MDRRQLEYFLAVVDLGSMSRAAESLHVSQPSVSQAIRSLERQIGSTLFERRATRLIITQTGEALVGPARQVMRDFEAAEHAVARLVRLEEGRIDLSIPAIMALHPTACLLAAFAAAHPNVQVNVEDQTAVNAVWEAVNSGRSEIGLVTRLEGTELKAHALGRHVLTGVFPPGSPNAGIPLTMEEIAELRWISGPALGFETRVRAQRLLAERGLKMQRWIVTAHRQTIPRLILSGVAPSLLIDEEAQELARFGAVLRPTDPIIDRPYYLIHRRERLSSAAQAFIELALDRAMGTSDPTT